MESASITAGLESIFAMLGKLHSQRIEAASVQTAASRVWAQGPGLYFLFFLQERPLPIRNGLNLRQQLKGFRAGRPFRSNRQWLLLEFVECYKRMQPGCARKLSRGWTLLLLCDRLTISAWMAILPSFQTSPEHITCRPFEGASPGQVL